MQAKDPLGVKINQSVLDKGKITSLEEYFAHIGYLADYHTENIRNNPPSNVAYQNSAKFLMLPMDEKYDVKSGCFYIDLNSRNIQVPDVYSKYGVSVTGDQLAETLMFKVPRYFDYTDLASTEIYVQWTNPAGDEGASRIVLVDFEAEEGYLLFGWPLTSKVTVEGKNPLKFSVRFFVRNEEKEIQYSLNTLPVSVMIKQALYTNFNADLNIDDPSLLFAAAVENGVDSNTTLPQIPVFFYDWKLGNDEGKAFLENDSIKLYVSGATPDAGQLCYKWYYTPRFIEDNIAVSKDPEEVFKAYAGRDTIFMPTRDTEKEDGKTYYVEALEAETGRKIYTTFLGDAFEEGEDAPVYYEQVSVYTILAANTGAENALGPNKKYWPHVTGEYKVMLSNQVGSSKPAESVDSLKCVIPCVENIEFTTDLPKNKVLSTTGDGEEAISQAILTVIVDVNDDADRSYVWYKAESSDSDYVEVPGASNATMTATNPGWYKVKAIGTLNRESMWKESSECKVTYPAEAPTITNYLVDGIKYPIPDDDPTLENVPGLNTPITFKIEIEEMDEFQTDGITYKWFRNTPNQNGTPIKDTDLDVISVNGNEITVKLLANSDLPVNIAFYYCEITNTLAGEEKKTTSKVFQIS